jgi:hypothetical protein
MLRILILYQPRLGGTNVVLKRASEWLINHGHTTIDLCDIETCEDKKFDLTLLPTSEMYRLPPLIENGSSIDIGRALVWAMGSRAFHGAYCNPMNDSLTFKFLTFPLRMLANRTLNSLLRDRTVIFTDEVGMYTDIEINRDRKLDFMDLIYPVPINTKTDVVIKRFPSHPRRFMWIGRVDRDFKVLPLLRVIRDISDAVRSNSLTSNVEFLIVGSGDGDELIHQAISNISNVKFTWLKWVDLHKLDELLSNEVDILFAMGASALQGASMGIPTVIVQPFSHPSQETSEMYRWIHHTVGHSLGEFPWFHCQPAQPSYSFDELLKIGTLHENALNALEFSKKFDTNIVFERLFTRKLPSSLSSTSKFQLRIYMYIYKIKYKVKILLSWVANLIFANRYSLRK